MAKFQHKILVVFLFFTCQLVFSNDPFEGIWRGRNTNNPENDSFVAIQKISDRKYFVIFTNPFWEHQGDCAEYGYLNNEGYIVVTVQEIDAIYYFEIHRGDGNLYHYWNTLYIPSGRYERIADEARMIEKNKLPEFTPEMLYDFIYSQ